jgi:hypothetical protein
MNTKILLLPLVVIMMLAVFPSAVSTNHAWNSYHGARTANPFTVKLGDNLSAGWKAYLSQPSADWSKSTVLDTTIVAGVAKEKCRPTSGQDEVCNGAGLVGSAGQESRQIRHLRARLRGWAQGLHLRHLGIDTLNAASVFDMSALIRRPVLRFGARSS